MSEEKEKKKRFGILKDYWKIINDAVLIAGMIGIVAPIAILICKGIKEFWNWVM